MPRPVLIALLIAALALTASMQFGAIGPDDDVVAAPIATPAPKPRARPGLPAAPSLAGKISPARRRFIGLVDQTCVSTYNRGQASQAAYERRVAGRPNALVLSRRFYARWHAGQYRALQALGRPPDGNVAYRRWLDNFGLRVRLEARMAPLLQSRPIADAHVLARRVLALKQRGNLLGQRFGLQLCTSNARDLQPRPPDPGLAS